MSTNELVPVWTLLANSLRCVVKSFKSRNAGRSERIAIKPVTKTNQIDRSGDCQMLQMRFGQPHIPNSILSRHDTPLNAHPEVTHWTNILEGLQATGGDVLVEATGATLRNGEPAVSYIRAALSLGMHVITSSKVLWPWRDGSCFLWHEHKESSCGWYNGGGKLDRSMR